MHGGSTQIFYIHNWWIFPLVHRQVWVTWGLHKTSVASLHFRNLLSYHSHILMGSCTRLKEGSLRAKGRCRRYLEEVLIFFLNMSFLHSVFHLWTRSAEGASIQDFMTLPSPPHPHPPTINQSVNPPLTTTQPETDEAITALKIRPQPQSPAARGKIEPVLPLGPVSFNCVESVFFTVIFFCLSRYCTVNIQI